MTLRDAIAEVRSYVQDGHSTRANEQETKEWFISPILRALGWVGPNRLASESRPGQERTRMDYSLLGPQRTPLALIEAKASRRALADNDVTQMLRYDFHQAGVDVCVLTNGIVWWLYLPREKGSPAERRFAAIDLQDEDLADTAGILESCLEYEALTSGSAEKRAKEMLAAIQLDQRMRDEIPRAWQRLVAGPNEMLIELVQEEVQDALGARPDDGQVREELRSFFDQQRPPVGPESPRTIIPPISSLPEPAPSPSTARRRKNPKTQVVAFRLWGQTYSVQRQWEVLANVADLVYLRHSHNFEQVLRLGRFHQSADDCRKPHQIGNSGVFVDCHLSYQDMKRTCERLLGTYGYSVGDLEIVTEDLNTMSDRLLGALQDPYGYDSFRPSKERRSITSATGATAFSHSGVAKQAFELARSTSRNRDGLRSAALTAYVPAATREGSW